MPKLGALEARIIRNVALGNKGLPYLRFVQFCLNTKPLPLNYADAIFIRSVENKIELFGKVYPAASN